PAGALEVVALAQREPPHLAERDVDVLRARQVAARAQEAVPLVAQVEQPLDRDRLAVVLDVGALLLAHEVAAAAAIAVSAPPPAAAVARVRARFGLAGSSPFSMPASRRIWSTSSALRAPEVGFMPSASAIVWSSSRCLRSRTERSRACGSTLILCLAWVLVCGAPTNAGFRRGLPAVDTTRALLRKVPGDSRRRHCGAS